MSLFRLYPVFGRHEGPSADWIDQVITLSSHVDNGACLTRLLYAARQYFSH